MSRGVLEDSRLPDVLCRPRFGRKLESFGSIQIRGFVRRHPSGVVKKTPARVLILFVNQIPLGAVLEILAERLQEDGVRPAAFGIAQAERLQILLWMNTPPDQFLRFAEILDVVGQPMRVEQRID